MLQIMNHGSDNIQIFVVVVVVVADILVLHLAMHLKQIAAISINLIRIHFNQLQTQWQQPETATRKHGFLCFK